MRNVCFIEDLQIIDNALEQIGNDILASEPSMNRRTLVVELMTLNVNAWCSATKKDKSDFATASGLWSVYVELNGSRRTQTLDRYMNINTLPKRPRWEQVIKSAEFILESCDLKPMIKAQLETMLTKFRTA